MTYDANTPSLSRRTTLRAAGAAALGTLLAPDIVAAVTPVMAPRYTIGCYTRPWARFDYPVALDAIAEAGFQVVGLMTTKGGQVLSIKSTQDDAIKAGDACKKRGLSVASAWGGGFPLDKGPDAAIEGLKKLIDLAAAAGCANLLMGGVGKPEQEGPYYGAIARCCDYAAEKKVGLSLKPHGGSNATGPQCRATVEKVGHKNFGIWYDPGNIFYYSDGKLDPVDDAPSVAGRVVGMSVKDYVHPKKVDVTPGTGQVKLDAVMAKLKKGGFTAGALVIECLTPGDEKQLLAEAKKAREYVEGVIKNLA